MVGAYSVQVANSRSDYRRGTYWATGYDGPTVSHIVLIDLEEGWARTNHYEGSRTKGPKKR